MVYTFLTSFIVVGTVLAWACSVVGLIIVGISGEQWKWLAGAAVLFVTGMAVEITVLTQTVR